MKNSKPKEDPGEKPGKMITEPVVRIHVVNR
jgi:hypothetical protein